MDKEVLKRYTGKTIYFLQDFKDSRQWSEGFLKEVRDDCIVIVFNGQEQVYSFDCIFAVREKRMEN